MIKRTAILFLASCIIFLSGCNDIDKKIDLSSANENAEIVVEMIVSSAISTAFQTEYKLDYYEGVEWNTVALPRICIESDTTAAINEKIITDFNKVGDEEHKDGIYSKLLDSLSTQTPLTNPRCYINSNYQYAVTNNVLALTVETHCSYFFSETSMYVNSYYYDIKADKELSLDEYLKTQSITKQQILSAQQKACKDFEFSRIDDIYGVMCYSNEICKIYGPGVFGVGAFDLNIKTETITDSLKNESSLRFALSSYLKAMQVYYWFDMSSMPVYDEIKIFNDIEYYKVKHYSIKTKADLSEYLLTIFDKKVVADILSGTEHYVDIDGELYTTNGGRGSNLSIGDENYKIIESTKNRITLRVSYQIYDEKTFEEPYETTIKEIEYYDYVLEKQGENWVFTNFNSIR